MAVSEELLCDRREQTDTQSDADPFAKASQRRLTNRTCRE